MTQNSFLDKKLLNSEWENNPRWEGITRNYSAEDVVSIRNSIEIKYTLAENGANNLFDHLMKKDEWISALGALSGNQAVQMVKAGLKAIYLSGWQVAADSNLGETTYPDQSLYPSNSAPNLAKRINKGKLNEIPGTALASIKLKKIEFFPLKLNLAKAYPPIIPIVIAITVLTEEIITEFIRYLKAGTDTYPLILNICVN